MKKIIAMLLALTMLVAFAGCNNTTAPETTEGTNAPETTAAPETTEAATGAAAALDILDTTWNLFGEDEKFFVMGGDFENMVDGAPGAVNVAGVDFLMGNLIVPEAETANVTEAASLIHAMNANTFTCAAYAVADVQAFADAMKTAIQGNHWMCGFPEKLVIAEVDGFVVVMFGHGDAVNPFLTNLQTAYPTTNVLAEEAIG